MDRRRPRGARQQRRAAAAPPPQAPPLLLAPYRLPGPVIDPRGPRAEEIFNASWAGGNTNFTRDNDAIGRKFMPLPPGAAEIEGTFFEFKNNYKTGEDLADLLMRAIYGEHLNRVGDKRREICHHLWRRSSNEGLFARLDNELKGLMTKLNAKTAELTELTNMVVPVPVYFDSFPSLV